MRSTSVKRLATALLLTLSFLATGWADDPGKKVIGTVRTELIFGTKGAVESLGGGTVELPAQEQERLRKVEKLENFTKFVKLGSVEQPVLAGYKIWAAPIKNSEAIMVTFQPQARIVEENKLRLDIEYWQKKKMALRWDRVFVVGKRVYLIGPKWREGILIITVELVSLRHK